MYDIGIARRAHPLQRLQARRRDFNTRMMSAPAQAPDAPHLPSQPALGSQSSDRLGLRVCDPFVLPSTSISQQRSGNNRGAFQVYTGESGTQASGNSWPELESRDSHRKENHRSAVSAQGETLKQKITVPSVPKLDVYVDEVSTGHALPPCIHQHHIQGVDAAPKTPGKTPSKELAAKGSTTEALKRDPLRNFQQQPLAPPPVLAPANLVPLGSSNTKLHPASISSNLFPSTSPAKNKVTSLPTVKANELLEIDLSLYTVADGTELNPAEQRTVRMGLSNKVWPAPPAHLLLAASALSASSNQDTSGDLSTGNVSGQAGRHREMTASVYFSRESTSHTSNTRRSRASLTTNRDPTVTINTKEGLMDVYGFFNSPTKSMKLEGIEESVRKPPKAALKIVDFSENAGVPPTPTPGTFKVGGENAMSMKKGGKSL
jgi:checkpoint serine/threonine-protein kinase